MDTYREQGIALAREAKQRFEEAQKADPARGDDLKMDAIFLMITALYAEMRHGNDAGPSPRLMGALDELTMALHRRDNDR